MLKDLVEFKRKNNFGEAFIFYVSYLFLSFILMGLLVLFGIITDAISQGEIYKFVYNISRITTPVIIILISSYICYKKNILDRMNFILLILLSALSSLFFITITGLIVPAYLTTK